MRLFGSLFLLCLTALLPSQAQAKYHSDGHIYDLSCNASGYVLQSRHPLVRTTGVGVGTRIHEGKETLYLGKSCDATHKLFGGGTWCWANGGFIAEFADHRFGFGRQELFCERLSLNDLDCRC